MVPFAHHFGPAMENPGPAQQALHNLIREYDVASADSSKDLLKQFTTIEIFENLRQYIDRRDVMHFQQLLGVFELDFIKVRNQRAEFEEWKEALIADIVDAKRNGEAIDKEFFEEFEYPVHPQVAIDLIAQYRILPAQHTLLHHAMHAVLAANGSHQFHPLIQGLLRVNYPMYVPDKEGRTALTIAVDKSPPPALFKTIVKYHADAGFNFTGLPDGLEESKCS